MNKKFITLMNKRYSRIMLIREIPEFRYWDDYAMFLFEDICNKDEDKYYELLEKDIKLYSDSQTGVEREVERNVSER